MRNIISLLEVIEIILFFLIGFVSPHGWVQSLIITTLILHLSIIYLKLMRN